MPYACYRRTVALLLQTLLVMLVLTAPAQAAPNHIAAELVTERGTGSSATIAILMRPAKGWHGYWSNPGDAGFGMDLKWTLPPGVTAGAPQYPVPETLLISGLMNHVYEHDYAVLVPLTLPPGMAAANAVPITLEAQWLACTDSVCVPERGTMTAMLRPAKAPADPRFDQWRRNLPAPLGSTAKFALEPQRIRIAIPLPAAVPVHDPHFFVTDDKVIDYAAVQTFSREKDLLIVEISRARVAPANPPALSGVLRLRRDRDDGLMISAQPGVVPQSGMPIAQERKSTPPLLPLLFGALLGGLLLNVMPCVFPILSLKALALARSAESEANARIEGLAYTAGVMLACLALGALLLVLRAGGSEVGWAFQLQEPIVIAALLLVAAAITANLLGLFELATPGVVQTASPRGAFGTGLLAAFVATPCTGPFMAAAMGAALLLPAAQALSLFAALGLGIALPFLAIAFIPALRRRLPRPGPWMATFRRWMALPMALAALALVWLASRVGGLNFALASVAITALLLALLTLAGRRQRAGLSAAGVMVAAALLVLPISALVLPRLVARPGDSARSLLDTQPFSAAALERARASGKPVFVWMTADWCLTCKVNEGVAIEREETRAAFARAGVIVLRGDWTRRDPEITRFLTAQGAAGVPLYVWYPAAGGPSRQLPQVLTPGLLAGLK